ncbi:hypothetical protein BDZ89DRAFT_482634 [Hymenopellis radicata]|nr:hypothetical protein BDZ89DRAFT_482634 [Hymenopellis radicata]
MASISRSNFVQIATLASATCFSIWVFKRSSQLSGTQMTAPKSLSDWQAPASIETRKGFWAHLSPVIERHGIRLWLPSGSDSLRNPDPEFPTNSSFLFVGPQLFSEDGGAQLKQIKLANGHLMAGTNREGIAVVLRVISKGEEGKEHLRMLRRVATGLESLVATNHMLPIWNEIVYDDVVCTVSPMVGPSIRDAFEWKGTSTGDVLDMVQQALEVGMRVVFGRLMPRILPDKLCQPSCRFTFPLLLF